MAEALNWQPIETAPKDGTKILVINNRGNQAVVLWGGISAEGWVPMFSDATPNPFLNGGCGSVCTHWMPLPKPPSRS